MGRDKRHEVRAKMDAYRWQCDAGYREFDADEYVAMQIAHADAPKEKWYKRLM